MDNLIKFINEEDILIKIISSIQKITIIKNSFFAIEKIVKNNTFIIGICAFDIKQFDNFIGDKKNYILPIPLIIQLGIQKRKAEYVASRLLVKNLLSYLGYKDFYLKNNLDRSPIWPNNINASLSHSDSYVIAIATKKNFFIGIDIEKYMKQQTAKIIFNSLLTPKEQKSFQRVPLPLHKLITLIFSLKESIYKAIWPLIKTPINFHYIIIETINIEKNTATIYLDKIYALKSLIMKKLIVKLFLSETYVITLAMFKK